MKIYTFWLKKDTGGDWKVAHDRVPMTEKRMRTAAAFLAVREHANVRVFEERPGGLGKLVYES